MHFTFLAAAVAVLFTSAPAHAWLSEGIDKIWGVTDGCGAVDSSRARTARYGQDSAASAACYFTGHDPTGIVKLARGPQSTAEQIEEMAYLQAGFAERQEELNLANRQLAVALSQLPEVNPKAPNAARIDTDFNKLERNTFYLNKLELELHGLVDMCTTGRNSDDLDIAQEACHARHPNDARIRERLDRLFAARDAIYAQTPVLRSLPELRQWAQAGELDVHNRRRFGTEPYHEEFRRRLKAAFTEQQRNIAHRETEMRGYRDEVSRLDNPAGFGEFKDRITKNGVLDEVLATTDPVGRPGMGKALYGANCRLMKRSNLGKATDVAKEFLISAALTVIPFVGEGIASVLVKTATSMVKAAGAMTKAAKVYFAMAKASTVVAMTVEAAGAAKGIAQVANASAKCERLRDDVAALSHGRHLDEAREASKAVTECDEAVRESAVFATVTVAIAGAGVAKGFNELGEISHHMAHVDLILANADKAVAAAGAGEGAAFAGVGRQAGRVFDKGSEALSQSRENDRGYDEAAKVGQGAQHGEGSDSE